MCEAGQLSGYSYLPQSLAPVRIGNYHGPKQLSRQKPRMLLASKGDCGVCAQVKKEAGNLAEQSITLGICLIMSGVNLKGGKFPAQLLRCFFSVRNTFQGMASSEPTEDNMWVRWRTMAFSRISTGDSGTLHLVR